MKPAFYGDLEYRKRQAEITRANWRNGKFQTLVKPLEKRICQNPPCKNSFDVKPFDPKKFCSKHCSVTFNNKGRKLSVKTKQKIAESVSRLPSSQKGYGVIPKASVLCLSCQKEFKVFPYLKSKRKFCSNKCAMKVIGGQTTSHKASKGKPGVRPDISSSICFYSTWEANVARVFNLLCIKWEYAPRIFDLGEHTYRPDFYLPDEDRYIEVKNFMNEYSRIRDELFREKYPFIQLDLIMKEDYKKLEAECRQLIPEWE